MGTFSITRDIMIAAPRERVYALVDDLREWERWSPWEALDPSMSHEYTGPDRGVGARHCWVGNKDAGEGEMLITDSSPDGVSLDLHFVKPFRAQNAVRIGLEEVDAGTRAVWTMTGRQNPLMKVLFAVMRVENRLGKDFERGLAQLKAQAELT